MKKSILTLLGVGLLLTSCQSDEPFAPVEGGEKQVTFTLTAPTSMTRAGEQKSSNLGGLSNKAADEELHYTLALYYGDNVEYKQSITSADASVTFNPTVILGRNYRVVAYADFVDGKTDLKTIDIANGINDEKKDAYFANPGNVVFTENDLAEQVTLTRPFGKLRLVATDYSDKTKIKDVSVTYRNGGHLNSFNAFKGEFPETTDATATYYDAVYDVEYDEEDGEKTIFVDYIPVNGNGVFPFEITVTYENGTESFTRTFAEDIPVRRNALTTLKGKFFTAEAKISVVVDDNFDDSKAENRTLVSSASQLQEVINTATSGETTEIILGNDIELTGSLVFGGNSGNSGNSGNLAPTRSEAAKSFVLDLNGKTIVGRVPKSVGHVIKICSGATLKVIGGTIKSTAANGGSAIYNAGTLEVDGTTIEGAKVRENGGWPSYPVNNYSNMTLMNVTITGYQGAIACSSAGTTTLENCTINKEYLNTSSHVFYIDNADANVVVNGGTYTHNGMDGSLAYVINGSITVNGGTFSASNGGYGMAALANGSITVNGGTFETKFEDWGGKITLTGGKFAAKPADKYIAAGYKAIKNGDKYYVVPNEFDAVATTAEELNKALANGGNVVLLNNINITKIDLTDSVTSDVVIDANGYTITTAANYGIQVKAGKNITIKNAKIGITVDGNYINYAAGLKIENGDYANKTIKLENCVIKMHNTDWAYAVNMPASVKNLNLVFDKCELEGAVAVQCWGDNNKIDITNSKLICNYTTSAQYTSYCVALQGEGTNNSENNTLRIENCEFLYSGIDNFNSPIYAIGNKGLNNTISTLNCAYGDKIVY